jgi:hypothetical protein
MSETRFPNGISGGNGADLELKSDSDIALYAADNIWISQGTKLIFEGTVPDDFEAKLQATTVTADRDIILPDASGTLALTTDIPVDISDLTDTGNLLSGGTVYTNSDVDIHLNTSTATTGQVLSWSGSDYDWIAVGSGTLTSSDLQNGTFDLDVNSLTISGVGTTSITAGSDIILDATNRVSVTDTPFRLASFTTVDRDNLIAVNGDMIYNSSTNKFQGYANGVWVDLH